MYNFNITLYNQKEKRWITNSVEKQTFAEAAREAYLSRNSMGFDWEIHCVSKTIKDPIEQE